MTSWVLMPPEQRLYLTFGVVADVEVDAASGYTGDAAEGDMAAECKECVERSLSSVASPGSSLSDGREDVTEVSYDGLPFELAPGVGGPCTSWT